MPLYAYRCTKCSHRFEKIQNFSAEPEQVCPQCGGALVRPLTAPALNFKGSGFYINDYAGKSPAVAADSAPAPAAPCAGSCDSCPAAAASTAS